MNFFTACTPPNDAGLETLPDEDLLQGNYVDTFTVEMRTILLDSVLSDGLSRSMIGNYVDNEFGRISAETFFQPRIKGSNVTFGEDRAYFSLDSIVLTLDLTDFYGRFDDPIPLEIFEITEDFADSVHVSRDSLAYDASYDFANGYTIDFSGFNGFFDFINIRLDDSLGRKLLMQDPATYVSNSTFTDWFKGLVIRSKPVDQTISREPGGIFSMDMRTDRATLTMYYKDTTNSKEFAFTIDDGSRRFTRIQRSDYQTRILGQAVDESGDPNAQYGAVQAGALCKLYVGVPGLKNLDPAGINRAEIILNVDDAFLGSIDRFEPPDEIYLYIADTTGTTELDPDIVNSSSSYDPVNKRYVLRITNALQQILAGRLPDNGFIIVPGDNGVSFNRAVFGGPGHPEFKPQVRVTYTSLPGNG